MAKRARWDGTEPQAVYWPPGDTSQTKPAYVVEPGKQLPGDAPAEMRDSLLKDDRWTEVEYTAPGKAKDEE